MSVERILLIVTAVIAVAALIAAIWAIRALKRVSAQQPNIVSEPASTSLEPLHNDVHVIDHEPSYKPLPMRADEPGVKVVDGSVVVRPTSQQIVKATMGQPLVRLNVIMFGLAHAFRPESRDRIRGLMRREFKARRKVRMRAARRAARVVPEANSSAPMWISSTAASPPPQLDRPLRKALPNGKVGQQ